MRIPKMSESSQYRVTVPALKGGINLLDAPHLVEDNQLTDALNMWWKDQALRVRPGLSTNADCLYTLSDNSHTLLGIKDLFGVPTFQFEELGEADFYRTALEVGSNGDTYWATVRKLFYSGMATRPWDDSIGGSASHAVDALYIDLSGNASVSSYLTEQLYYTPEGLILFSNGDSFCTPRKYDEPFEDMKPHLYAPLVLVNGRGAAGLNQAAVTGTLLEGYNLLTPRFRCQFTTDGEGIYFFLPQKHLDDREITVALTASNGQELVFTIPQGSVVSQTLSGWSVELSREGGYFWFKSAAGPAAYPGVGFSSNVEITAEKSALCDPQKIGGMRFYTWFGGDANGINGGTRLFMGGNPLYPNLVHWSDINNPLYFPENNYAYVGETDNAVTAFGRQSDMLVIFKERELYYATYMAGSSVTAQEVIDGAVVDVAANAACFPLTQISAGVGCDCPDTVQLCGNRLVWATSEGKVYVLATVNQFNERNACDISGMIGPELQAIQRDKWKAASAGDYDGHYVLLVDDRLYLFDYGASAFHNASAYTREDTLQKGISWYKWEVAMEGVSFRRFMARDTRGMLLGDYSHNGWTYRILFTLQGEEDMLPHYEEQSGEIVFTSRPIPAFFQTKVFDFGYPERRKTIRRLHMGATDTGAHAITLSYITEDGVAQDACRLGLTGDGKMREWMVTPGVSRVRQFGFRADSSGRMAVDSLVLRYEMKGEVR